MIEMTELSDIFGKKNAYIVFDEFKFSPYLHYMEPTVDDHVLILTRKLFNRIEYVMDPYKKNPMVSSSFNKFKSRTKYETKHEDSMIKNLEIAKKLMKHAQNQINEREFKKEVQELYDLADSYITAIKLT
ncbi:hypothetical protein D3C71_1538160 [compost metagenome]